MWGQPISLPAILFSLALCVYLASRLIRLADFPIYFFTDEAVQTILAADLVRDGFRSYEGVFLPTYFKNGNYYNLSVSVYLQVLPYLLFGKSVFVTRAVSVCVSLLAALSVGLFLRRILKTGFWWGGVLFLSLAPAWFLHSRTAFETVIFVSFYATTLYAYLLYRYRSPRYLYLTMGLAALAFYSYSPGQVIIAATALLLFLSDLPYHWRNRTTLLGGLAFLALLAIPYVRFRLGNTDAPLDHLRNLGSYWVRPGLVSEKLRRFAQEYAHGLSPGYWYFPHETDLPRHLMRGYGHLQWWSLPFAVLGLLVALKNVTSPAYRTILIALLAAPVGSALVEVGITRTLVYVIPACLLAGIGLSKTLEWIADPSGQLELVKNTPLGRWAGAVGKGIFSHIYVLLSTRFVRWRIPDRFLAIAVFSVLAAANFAMLSDALVSGPTWYSDYGMGGLQYGAAQLFPAVQDYLARNPDTQMIVSPSWSNGTDTVARFFVPEPLPFTLGSIKGHIFRKLPLDENTLFVMIPEEYEEVRSCGKFTDIRVEQTIPYPNGQPGFYFVRLRYVDNIDEILSAEQQERRQLVQAEIVLDGQPVRISYSPLDMGDITLPFDGDPYTVARTLEANPFVFELTFPQPRTLRGVSVIIGSLEAKIIARLYANPGAEPVEFSTVYQGSVDAPEANLDFGQDVAAQILHLEVQSIHESEPAHVHVWEITLR